jgi:hypothetical protein
LKNVNWTRFDAKLASDLSVHFAPNRELLRCQALMAEENVSGPDFICFGGQRRYALVVDQPSHHADFWMTPVKELHHVKQSIRGWRAEPLYARVSPNIDRVNFPRDVLGNRRCQGCLAMQLPFTALLRGKHGGMGRGKVIGLD